MKLIDIINMLGQGINDQKVRVLDHESLEFTINGHVWHMEVKIQNGHYVRLENRTMQEEASRLQKIWDQECKQLHNWSSSDEDERRTVRYSDISKIRHETHHRFYLDELSNEHKSAVYQLANRMKGEYGNYRMIQISESWTKLDD